jgi:hypothetical protein
MSTVKFVPADVPRPSFPSSFIQTNPFINQSINPFRCILILDIVRMVIVSFEFLLPQEFNEPWSQWDGDRQRTNNNYPLVDTMEVTCDGCGRSNSRDTQQLH